MLREIEKEDVTISFNTIRKGVLKIGSLLFSFFFLIFVVCFPFFLFPLFLVQVRARQIDRQTDRHKHTHTHTHTHTHRHTQRNAQMHTHAHTHTYTRRICSSSRAEEI
jgi:ABC-type nickel/cobalt efflux system permease component RcnA